MTVSVTAQVIDTYPPAVLVDVTSAPAVTAAVNVFRVHEDDGSRHRVLSTSRVLIGTWTGVDYHPPLNRLFHYVAEADGEAPSGPSPTQVVGGSALWLLHPTNPALSYLCSRVAPVDGAETYASRAAEFDILPAPGDEEFALPVVRSDMNRSGPTGRLTIRIPREDKPAVLNLLRRGAVVLMNGPWPFDLTWSWIRVGDVAVTNKPGHESFPWREVEFDWRACRQPDADTAPQLTFTQLAQISFPEAAARYRNFRDMQLDVRTS